MVHSKYTYTQHIYTQHIYTQRVMTIHVICQLRVHMCIYALYICVQVNLFQEICQICRSTRISALELYIYTTDLYILTSHVICQTRIRIRIHVLQLYVYENICTHSKHTAYRIRTYVPYTYVWYKFTACRVINVYIYVLCTPLVHVNIRTQYAL